MCSAGLAEGRSAFETSEVPAPAVLALQGLNSTLSFMRSYSLILARALSKWITVLPVSRTERRGKRGKKGDTHQTFYNQWSKRKRFPGLHHGIKQCMAALLSSYDSRPTSQSFTLPKSPVVYLLILTCKLIGLPKPALTSPAGKKQEEVPDL